MKEDEILGYGRIDRQGRITIPKKVRELLNLEENDQVFWKRKGDYIIFGKVETIFKEKIE